MVRPLSKTVKTHFHFFFLLTQPQSWSTSEVKDALVGRSKKFGVAWHNIFSSMGQNLSALTNSGHLKKISPGQNGSNVGQPENARGLRFFPKFFKNDCARWLRNFLRGLITMLGASLTLDILEHWCLVNRIKMKSVLFRLRKFDFFLVAKSWVVKYGRREYIFRSDF